MASTAHQEKGRDLVTPTLDVFIQALNIAKDACGIPPAQIALGSACTLLTMIRDTMANCQDYVELGRNCGNVCQVLHRRLKGKQLDELNRAALDAIGDLTTYVVEMQRKVNKRGKRNAVFRFVLAKRDKDEIAAWNQGLVRVLRVFNTELAIDTNMRVADTQRVVANTQLTVTNTQLTVTNTQLAVTNTQTMVADIHRNMLTGQKGTSDQDRHARSVIPNAMGFPALNFHSVPLGELPPPAPRDCFGREELIEKIVGLAESLSPIALIGAGGIGKTSISLAVLHDDRIKIRFGDNRRFLRCDQFSASRVNFLNRLSEVIGAGVDNPKDLAPLRPSLSSHKLLLILDNAESILDPLGTDAEETFNVVEELSQLDNIWLCITSRITTVPPGCKCLDVPTLSMDAARNAFYRIYDNDEPSGGVDEILKQLDFHPLSVTLLATVARQNKWSNNRLVEEWEQHQTGILRTGHKKSLAVAIELSLASPMFQQLGPDARGLLGVVAFFPQGIHQKNLDWLFPTIPDRKTTFDKFCVLSLTYQSDGFITMLAPLRDYLYPKNPKESRLLSATKDLYITRLSVIIDPKAPGFKDTRWITSEDANVEHLLNAFSSSDPNSKDTWDACSNFMNHLTWHKPRQTVLGQKIEQLPDDHPCKPRGLFNASDLSRLVGNLAEEKRLLTVALKLWRMRSGSDDWVAWTLDSLAEANLQLGLLEEGIRQAEEASGIYERLGNAAKQALCLSRLASLLLEDKQLNVAEEVAIRSINLLRQGQEYILCRSHRVLGCILGSKGERGEAIRHFNIALGIANAFNWREHLFWIHYQMAILFRDEGEFDKAHTHITQAKADALDNKYRLARAMDEQAQIWRREGRDEDAATEALGAIEMYRKLGAAIYLERCTNFLQDIERSTKKP